LKAGIDKTHKRTAIQTKIMKASKDAYGQEIYAYFKDPDVAEIVERDDGYIDSGPASRNLYFAPFKKWPKMEKRAIGYAKGAVLDIGCGAGRLELYLQKRGHYVLGIDNSPLAIKVCKLRGVRKAKVMSITIKSSLSHL